MKFLEILFFTVIITGTGTGTRTGTETAQLQTQTKSNQNKPNYSQFFSLLTFMVNAKRVGLDNETIALVGW
jgi:hypothetical protein